jgi:3-hydroxybutyryl-CoA dehydrogenase
VLQIADYPGLLVWRTVAMLVNEALDALQKGVASAEDIDTAMRLGVNYPRGPLAWGESLAGAGAAAAGKPAAALWRRALSPLFLLRQKALMEKHHEQ